MLFIVLERNGAELDGPGEAEEADDEDSEDSDKDVMEDAEEEVFGWCCTALALPSRPGSCTVSFHLLLTIPPKSPPVPVLTEAGCTRS